MQELRDFTANVTAVFATVAAGIIVFGAIIVSGAFGADPDPASQQPPPWSACWQSCDGWHRASVYQRPTDLYDHELGGYLLIDDSTGETFLVSSPVWKRNLP